MIDSTERHYDAHLRQSYDREAERYDELRYHSAKGRLFNDLELDILRDWLPNHRGVKVLDIPVGTGRLSSMLARSGANVVGADVSRGMLRIAAHKATTDGLAGQSFVQASGTHLPFGDDAFDAVISFKFFHLIPNDLKRAFILEMCRVLKPGSRMIIEFNSPFYGAVLAFVRYHFQKRRAGGMRMKCLFPDQIPALFNGLVVTRTQGVKVPLSEWLQPLIGLRATAAFNHWFGRLPAVRYLAYAIVIEAQKPTRDAMSEPSGLSSVASR